MRRLYVGNPISLLLGYSYALQNSRYYIVREEVDLRTSNRDTTLAFDLQERIATHFNLDHVQMSFSDFKTAYSSNTNFITEFRYVNYMRKDSTVQKMPKVEAISFGADVYLANSGNLESLRGPRSFKVIRAWKKELRKCSNVTSFIVPELSNNFPTILDCPVKLIPNNSMVRILKDFSSSTLFDEFIGSQDLSTKPLLIVGPDYYGFDLSHAEDLVSTILNIPNSEVFQILMKPHPASVISPEIMSYFEDQLGRQTLNTILRLDMDRIKTCPLEVFMAANDSNLYVGIYTAGIAGFSRHRVFWVSSSDKFSEKMYKINYRKFLSYWSGS
jgi:hypothetical protein